jgi:putative ABC transport system ATP-binding protein
LNAALDLRGVSRAREKVFRLDIPDFVLAAGEAVALVGASGSGKSTLINLAGLALRPDRAERLQVMGTDAAALWRAGRLDALARLRAKNFGFLLQGAGLLPFLTVRRNVQVQQRLAARVGDNRAADTDALARTLGIGKLLDRFPAQLSQGERQRAELLRALAHRPAIVLADEPTANIHPDAADAVFGLLADQVREAGAALVVATHDPDRAARAGLPCLHVRTALDGATNVSIFTKAAHAATDTDQLAGVR